MLLFFYIFKQVPICLICLGETLQRRFAVKPQKCFVYCTPTFRQREGEKIMTEFSLLGGLILYVRET